MYKNHIKRLLDIIFSILLMIMLSWLFILIMLLTLLTSKGPLFFKQRRIGVNKTEFNIIKFRTMNIEAPRDLPTHLLHNPEKYITPFGKFLRATSLDELPQLINILKGDMSFVGPRPALWNQSDLIQARDKYNANNVKPGLTGWAQVNGRDELTISEKAKLDGEYVKKMNFIFDVKCIIKTFTCVLSRNGYREGVAHTDEKIVS